MKHQHLNLTVPRSWRTLSSRQLEDFARVLHRHVSTGSVDMVAVKTELYLLWTGIGVLEVADTDKPAWEQVLLVTHADVRTPFHMNMWELKYFIDENMKWMDMPQDIPLFPYPELRRFGLVKFHGPDVYAQNFSWRQYLTAADYMDFYRDSQNNMVRLMNNRKASATDLKVARRHVDEAKSRFLATIFNRSIRYVDISTQHVSREYTYVATQTESNAVYFRHFDDVKFQVVLFWWVGLMNYLQKSFPECFKVSPAKNPQQADPLQMRVRTTAALEKYLNGSEESVYRENYMNQLQHLSDMIKQGKEMDKLYNKR